ncbi:MAG: hypothetical protein KAT16_09685 [Candidatus Heimdallarchaeota archaeon]|nr:hypothetical protein [Candidatus Heimdallarchaeota archaeon]
MDKLKELAARNYKFGKYDNDPSVQNVKKKKKKKEDLFVALAISKMINPNQGLSR